MIEGWHSDDYLVLFEGDEPHELTARYGIADHLPGYTIVGLRGWDDFIVTDGVGLYTVPTVPLDVQYLHPFELALDPTALEPDRRLAGRVKWYVQPLVFGGTADDANTQWIAPDQHAELVRWWNEKYREIRAGQRTR